MNDLKSMTADIENNFLLLIYVSIPSMSDASSLFVLTNYWKLKCLNANTNYINDIKIKAFILEHCDSVFLTTPLSLQESSRNQSQTGKLKTTIWKYLEAYNWRTFFAFLIPY